MAAATAVILLQLILLVATGGGGATVFTITNRCSYTVWPAAVPVGGGVRLSPGQTWVISVPNGTSTGSIWGRTGCSFSGGGKGGCQTGDCDGALSCNMSGRPPATLAEFSTGTGMDIFDLSVIDGFNLPVDFLPAAGGRCSRGPRCLDKDNCADAYQNPSDNKSFTCPSGASYSIIFCSTLVLPSLPPVPTPESASAPPTTDIPIPPSSHRKNHIFDLNTPQRSDLPAPAPSSTSVKSSSTRIIVVILAPVGAFIFLLVTIITTISLVAKRRTRRREMEEDDDFGELQGTPMRFTFQQLKEATDQFRNKLGEGGFGSVFEGRIGDERIAVKRLDRIGQGKKEFSAEVQIIGSVHHINLVRLIGFCAEKSHRLLVYEYMAKGSLDRWIYYQNNNNTCPLDWQTRCKIITHIAKGLSYLHEECTKRIAHLDVKPQNILLDNEFDAKISDFGLCKLIDRDQSQVVTIMRGTPGYLAPEWLTSQITEKADVYSFGVVVMEMISGRKNLDTCRSEESIHLITLLEEKLKNDQLVDLIDRHISDMQVHKQEVIQMMKLAMWCLQIDCKRRPQMSEVVKVLECTMNVETNIDHNFVATSLVYFGYNARNNEGLSAPHLASDVSGPR